MNSTQYEVIKALIENKKYDVITEYSHIAHPDAGNIIVNEYAGSGVRVYKDTKGNTRLLCPKNMDVVQEGHVAEAIANGTIFDDADEVDRNASMIERTTIPYDAMINAGKDTPKQLRPVIAIVIGKMDSNGSFDVSDEDRTNGVNLVKDLCDKEKCPDCTEVVDKYIDKDKSAFYTPELGKTVTDLDKEVDDIVDTNPEDVISDTDTVDSYDDYDMDEFESDNSSDDDVDDSDDDTTDDEDSESDDDADDEDTDDDEALTMDDDEDDSDDDSGDDTVEECGDTDTVEECGDKDTTVEECGDKDTVEECGDADTVQEEDETAADATADTADTATDDSEQVVEEEAKPTTVPTEGTDAKGNVNNTPIPMSAQTKAIVNSNSKMHQEGFLSKKPKKLKPLGRDLVAYITVEMNDIRSANDQAMLSGYTCSKIELVDFYITILDTQDPRYIVPHTKQYLVQMKNDLERLLAQILRIRPINRSEQIWRVNYPTSN